MNRIAACIEYDGTAYCGWQRQKHVRNTIQEELEQALSEVANSPIQVICAGRTDSGVHATMQIVHFDTDAERSERSWIRGSNTILPADISIKWVKPVDDNFHARFLAVRRQYHYIIDNSPLSKGAINRFRSTWDYRRLDVERMQQAASILVGEHDFSSFRAIRCQAKSPVKTMYRLDIVKRDNFIILTIEANAFLHHMVRNIAGVLMAIAAGEQEVAWCKYVLEAKDRTVGGVTARPDGLYLTKVNYPEEYQLPETASGIILIV